MKQTLYLNHDGSFRVGPELAYGGHILKVAHLPPLKLVLMHDEMDKPVPLSHREYVKRYETFYYDIYEEV